MRSVADPKQDYISAIFYAVNTDVCNRSNDNLVKNRSKFCGRIALNTFQDYLKPNQLNNELTPIFVSHELQLFAELTNIVQRLFYIVFITLFKLLHII